MATLSEAMELAGYFGAHAIWCVSDAETLVPMLAGRDRDGAVSMRRFENDPLERAVSEAREALAKNPDLHPGSVPSSSAKRCFKVSRDTSTVPHCGRKLSMRVAETLSGRGYG